MEKYAARDAALARTCKALAGLCLPTSPVWVPLWASMRAEPPGPTMTPESLRKWAFEHAVTEARVRSRLGNEAFLGRGVLAVPPVASVAFLQGGTVLGDCEGSLRVLGSSSEESCGDEEGEGEGGEEPGSSAAASSEPFRVELGRSSVRHMKPMRDGSMACALFTGDVFVVPRDTLIGRDGSVRRLPDGDRTGKAFALCQLPGGRLAVGRGSGVIDVWDLDTDTRAAVLDGAHRGGVTDLAAVPESASA